MLRTAARSLLGPAARAAAGAQQRAAPALFRGFASAGDDERRAPTEPAGSRGASRCGLAWQSGAGCPREAGHASTLTDNSGVVAPRRHVRRLLPRRGCTPAPLFCGGAKPLATHRSGRPSNHGLLSALLSQLAEARPPLPGFAAGAVAVQGPTDITSAVKNPSAEI